MWLLCNCGQVCRTATTFTKHQNARSNSNSNKTDRKFLSYHNTHNRQGKVQYLVSTQPSFASQLILTFLFISDWLFTSPAQQQRDAADSRSWAWVQSSVSLETICAELRPGQGHHQQSENFLSGRSSTAAISVVIF